MNKSPKFSTQKDTAKKAEFYINKYLIEIERHFDLQENDVIKILMQLIKKKKYTSKKWWNFFQKSI